MTNKNNDKTVVIAGASGLVGSEVLKLLLEQKEVTQIYALSRKALPFFHPKLDTVFDDHLKMPKLTEEQPKPTYGYICLGTTKKQAGSQDALEEIDYYLVKQTAAQMKQAGVNKLAVVSSLGASARSLSHYLRCKGKMEKSLAELGFDQLVFVRPGPLKGLRDEPRSDEALLQSVMKVVSPIMVGYLANFIPIAASQVALSMRLALESSQLKPIAHLDSRQMLVLNQQHSLKSDT